MIKKEIVMVKIDGERLQNVIAMMDRSRKQIADEIGCSESTIRRAIKTGRINEEYLKKLPEVLGLDEKFYTGEKGTEAVAKAVRVLADYITNTEE